MKTRKNTKKQWFLGKKTKFGQKMQKKFQLAEATANMRYQNRDVLINIDI